MNIPDVHIPDVHSWPQIIERARTLTAKEPIRAALVDISDLDMLKAFAKAVADGLIEPTVFGDKNLFQKLCDEQEIAFDSPKIEHAYHKDLAVINAAKLAFDGRIDLLVKGRTVTADMLKALFDLGAYYVSKGTAVTHVAVMKPEKYPKLLLLSDSAVIVEPDLRRKLSIIENLVGVGKCLGIDDLRVAVLAAVEVVYPQMPVTIDAAVLAKMSDRRQTKGAIVDGPLSFDVAVDMPAAHAKGVTNSPVAGQADALLAPNIEVANGVYKAMSLYTQCEIGGVIVGGRVPIAIGSRVDTVESKYDSIVLGVLTA
jgi:phosphate butyryltransferase